MVVDVEAVLGLFSMVLGLFSMVEGHGRVAEDAARREARRLGSPGTRTGSVSVRCRNRICAARGERPRCLKRLNRLSKSKLWND